jgi:hypothetical protein
MLKAADKLASEVDGSQFENLIYSNIGDILLETLFACRVFSKR